MSIGPIPSLERFTTQYSETEDRISIVGETSEHRQVVLWLTRRLLDRLLPALTQWLEKQTVVETRGEIFQYMAQRAARAALDPQAPVERRVDTRNAIVHTVNITAREHGIEIVLRVNDAGGEAVVAMLLQGRQLRQWLNIIFDQYSKAEWSLEVWPTWIREAQASRAAPSSEVVVH